MAYQKDGIIEASDFNGFRDRMMALWGSGSGNIGYGQPSVIPSVVGGFSQLVSGNEWTLLRNAIYAGIHTHGYDTNLLPLNSELLTGQKIIAYRHSDGTIADIPEALSLLEANPQYAHPIAMNETQYEYTLPLGDYNNGYEMTVEFVFTTVNDARYFFNAGGQIVIMPDFIVEPTIPVTPIVTRGIHVMDFLATVSAYQINYNTTKTTGSIIQQSNKGYYTIINSATVTENLLTSTSSMMPTPPPLNATFSVDARTRGAITNGGNGVAIRAIIRVTTDMSIHGVPMITLISNRPNKFLSIPDFSINIIENIHTI